MPARFRLREDRLRVISTAKSCAVKRTRQLLFRCNERTNWRNVRPVKRIDDRNGELGFMKSREMKHRSDGIIVTAQWIVREPNEITSGVDTCRRFITRWNRSHRIHIYIYISNVIINEYFESIQRDRDFAHPRDFYFLLLYHQKELKND